MKKGVLVLLFVLSSKILLAQDKEWAVVADLLSKETACFSGKSGYFRLLRTSFTDFKYLKTEIIDDVLVSEVQYTHRFSEPDDSETIMITKTEVPSYLYVKSVQILYDYVAYFDDFPKSLFLKIEFNETIGSQTTLKTKNKDEKHFTETKTEEMISELIIPIRAKDREKILKAIDHFSATDFKKELENDTYH